MKIDLVSAVFSPEPITSARANADLAEQLTHDGHRVRVITPFPNRPAGKLYEGYRRQPWLHDRSFGSYEVLRCFSILSSKSTMWSRFLENLSFGIMSGIAVLLGPKPDLVYAHTWPIFAQGILALVCQLRGIPFVTRVQDLYPESLLVQDRLEDRSAWLFRLLRWIDMKIKQSSAGVIVISESFRKVYLQDRHIPSDKIHLIPNWIDENYLQINPTGNNIRSSHRIPEDAFLVMYAGNVGAAAGVDTVITAFQKLSSEENIYLLVAGEGAMLSHCRELAQKAGNPRILFHTPWLSSETSCVLGAANLFVLPTQGDQSMVSVPSKLMAYMLAGRPVLSCVAEGSEIAAIISEAGCGRVIAPGKPDAIAQEISSLSQRPPGELEEFGKRGRTYALKHMSRKANFPKLVSLVESMP
jgi:colanic acid biosynthesis glycosyl transferase WcaI